MTAQVSDFLRWEDQEYSIAALENDIPFTPQAYGFEPVVTSTGCWRGYFCRFAVSERGLVLDELSISLGVKRPFEWCGSKAEQGEFFKYDNAWVYRAVGLLIPYDGGIVVGRDFLREFYVHMGFHRPHCYREVWELVFRQGTLVGSTNHSERMASIRERIQESKQKNEGSVRPSRVEIAAFVEDAFSLKYEKKWA